MTTATLSRAERLAAMEAPKPKASSKKTVAAFERPELKDKTRRYAELIQMGKDIEAEKGLIRADLLAPAETLRIEESRKLGALQNSVIINGLSYVTQRKYTPLANTTEHPTRINDIKQKFGALSGRYFREVYTIGIDIDKLSDELLDALAAAGAVTTRTLIPTEAYHADRILKPEVEALAATEPDVKFVAYFQDKE